MFPSTSALGNTRCSVPSIAHSCPRTRSAQLSHVRPLDVTHIGSETYGRLNSKLVVRAAKGEDTPTTAVQPTVVPDAVADLEVQPEAVEVDSSILVPAPTHSESCYTEYTDELVTVQLVAPPPPFSQRASQFMTGNGGLLVAGSAAAVLLLTLGIAVRRYFDKFNSPPAVRRRNTLKNKAVVDELAIYLPDKRSQLTPGVVRVMSSKTGFSKTDIFRKYLWYALGERQFGPEVVEDLVTLKAVAGLSDDDVASALRDRAKRIYETYGTLMLNTQGMTSEGLERKASCQGLFSKLLFLTEYPPLLAQGSQAAASTDVRTIFGATDEDVERLRIVSLYEMDLDKLDKMASSTPEEEEVEERKKEGGLPGPDTPRP